MAPPAPLTKTTLQYAVHDLPLECDVYIAADYPSNGPVFLYFHPGGLVCGGRNSVSPWIVQTCFKNKWPLVSASYRLLPQVDGPGLLDDARSAYEFARRLGDASSGRHVIVGGCGAGVFLATLIAHHCKPSALALVSITGIPTFQHAFFNSSILIPPEPVDDMNVEPFLSESVSVGSTPDPDRIFCLDSLDSATGARSNSFVRPPSLAKTSQVSNRGLLYDHFLYTNMYPVLVNRSGEVDPGDEWAGLVEPSSTLGSLAERAGRKAKLERWPQTIVLHGDADFEVDVSVSRDVATALGQKAVLILAEGMEHSFEGTKFLEDEEPGMDAVSKVVKELERAVAEGPWDGTAVTVEAV